MAEWKERNKRGRRLKSFIQRLFNIENSEYEVLNQLQSFIIFLAFYCSRSSSLPIYLLGNFVNPEENFSFQFVYLQHLIFSLKYIKRKYGNSFASDTRRSFHHIDVF